MRPSDLTLETILRFIPEVEELDELRLALVRAGVRDPSMEWARSGALSTVDKRLLPLERAEAAIREAEQAYAEQGKRLFAACRSLAGALAAGREAEAVRVLISLGERKEAAGLFASARKYFEAALSTALPLADRSPQIEVLARLGRVARTEGDLSASIGYYERGLELARDAGDAHGQVGAGIGLGYSLALQGRWLDAERSHLDALAGLEGGEDDASVARGQIYNNLGYFAARQDRLDDAGGWLDRAAGVWSRVDSPPDRAVWHHAMALICKARRDWDGARGHYRQALGLRVPRTMRAGIAIDLAESYLESGDAAEAEKGMRAAEEEAITAASPYILGRVYQVRGNVARALGQEDGFTFYEKALDIARERGLRLLEGETLTDYAGLRMQMGETDEAASYLHHARGIFEEAGAGAELRRVDELLRATVEPPTSTDPPV